MTDTPRRYTATVTIVEHRREVEVTATSVQAARFLAWEYDQGFMVYRMGPGFLTGEDPAPTHWQPLPPTPLGVPRV